LETSRSRQILLAVLALGCLVQSSACWWTPLRGPNFGPLSAFFRKEGLPEVPRRTDRPVYRVILIGDGDKICPKCGGGLQVWAGQFEQSDEIDVVERSYRIVRHKRQKYRCQCGECIDTALGPDKLLPGGRYSVDFAISVAIGKYADHLPLARQSRMMARDGLLIDTQTLWDQIFVLARHTLSRPTKPSTIWCSRPL
jgi:transposase